MVPPPPVDPDKENELFWPGYVMDYDIANALKQIATEQQMFGEGSKYPRMLPPLPKVLFEPQLEPPPEPSGVGVNKKVNIKTKY